MMLTPVLPLLIDWMNTLLAGIMRLILIFRLYFLGDTIELVQIFLTCYLLIFLVAHMNAHSPLSPII